MDTIRTTAEHGRKVECLIVRYRYIPVPYRNVCAYQWSLRWKSLQILQYATGGNENFSAVLRIRIRIRKDPKLLAESGSDPEPK
jgi:hypothetical protein